LGFHKLSYGKPLILINFEAALDKLFELERDFSSKNGRFQYFPFKFNFSLAVLQWSIPMKQLINNYSQCPNIGFWAVLIIYETFRTHVNGTADVEISECLSVLDSKSEVSNLGIPI
jgi:hypothetical protein